MSAGIKQKCFMALHIIAAAVALLYLLLIAGFTHAAVPSLELFAASGDTVATGPILSSQSRTYLLNANNPNDNNTASYTPNTTVTLGISNQQYSNSNYLTTGAPSGNAMMFGGEGNNNSDSVASATIFVPLSTKGNPSNSVFTATSNTPVNQGISVASNYGTRFFVSTEPLQRANLSRTGRHYMGDITVTFNRPIIEPVIHVGGLGGTANSGLGFSAEFDLQTPGFTLAQLSGSSELTVNSTQILNNASNIGAVTGSGGASGSVVIKGGAITSLTFKVYMRGDGRGNAWDSAGVQNGDAFVFSAGSMDASVDLSVEKTQRLGTSGTFSANDLTIPLNGIVQYQLVFTNNGPQYVTNATFSDVLPNALTTPTIISNSNPTACPSPSFSGNTLNGTLSGTAVGAGSGSAVATCTIVIQAIGTTNADITNTATISTPANITDLNSANNSDSVKTRIGTGSPATDVIVGKTDGLDSIAQGASNTYTIRVINNGANPVTGAILKDPATTGLTKTGAPACTSASGNACTSSTGLTNALLESTGLVLPTIAANGGFYELTITATVGNATSITNTASIDVGNNYVNSGTSCTTNNGITRSFGSGVCSSTDTTTVIASGSLSFDSAIREARLGISPNIPTIWRGGGGQQTITITNNGPDTANNAFATYTESLQTGVGVNSVTLTNGTSCSVNGTSPRVWRCPLGTLSNGSSANFLVNYTTTTASTLGNGQTEGIVRAGSDELNPGSGVGESAYRIWGSETQQRSNPLRYSAFMVGYNGTGGNVTGSGNGNFGPYSYEGSSIESAWPASQASPTGGYLNNGIAGANISNYLASSNNAAATIQRLLTTLTNIQVSLPREDTSTNLTDNRRAWELKTGALIPAGTSQNVTLCIGNSSQKLDDSAYVMVNGVRQGAARDTYAPTIYTVPITLNAGYNVITYRIANRNSTSGDGGEVNAGGFSTIGLSSGTDCLPAELNTLINQGEPVKINIIDAAALVITKTNSTNLINSNGQSTYSITVENQGPSDVTGAILKDPVASNMIKGTPVCSTVTNNQCTSGTTPTIAQLQGASGFTLPKLSSGQKYVLNVPVTFSADNVTSVTNNASVQSPTGVTALATACVNDSANGYSRTYDAATRTCSTSDTDNTRAHVRVIKNSVGGTGSFNFTLTNTSVTDETVTTTTAGTAVTGSVVHDVDDPALDMKVTENAATGYVLASASCVDNNAANSGNPTTAIGTLSGSSITLPAANLKAGADIRCTFNNNKLPTISLNKIANGGNDTFGFTLTNTSVATATVTTTTPASTTPVDADINTAGNQDFVVSTLNQNVTIRESTLPTSWKLSNAQCTNASNAVAGTFDASGNTYTILAAQVVAGAAFSCTFTNDKQRNLTLKKAWVNAKQNDAATVTATGLTSLNAVADTSTETDVAPAQLATVGSTITLGETITTGTGNYNAVLNCSKDSDNSVVAVNASNQIIMPDAAVSCIYTNTRKTRTVTLSKALSPITDSGRFNLLINGNAVATNIGNGGSGNVVVPVGSSVSISETAGTGTTLTNYNTTYSCNTSPATTGSSTSGSFTQPDANVACTFTNTRKSASLTIVKQWQNGRTGDAISIPATTGLTNNTTVLASTSAGSNSTTGNPVTVYAGETATLGSETFTTGSAANYNASVSCTGAVDTNLADGLTISPADSAITCTYTNTRKSATLTLSKIWSAGSIAGNTATVTSTGFANNATSGTSTATAAGNTTTGTSVTVYAGETGTISETFGTGTASNYNATLACSGNSTALSGNTLTINPADTAISCSYTNTVAGTDLAIDKTGTSSVTQGNTVSYSIKVWNKGPGVASSSTFTDTVPGALTNVSWSCSASGSAVCGTASGSGNTINVTTGTLPVNTSSTAPTSGSYLTFTVSGTASSSGNITNTANIAVTSGTDPVSSNNSSSASTTISTPSAITPDTPQKEARFTITPDLPTIYRGQAGTQLINITNQGPDDASSTVAVFKPRTQTGVTVTSVKIVNGANCSLSSGEWSCPVGSVANGGSFQLQVGYDTTASSTLGTAIQADIRVGSNEFNPGSGVGESLYNVWGSTNPNGSSQFNEIRPNGAFALGYGTANANENVNLSTAWLPTQVNPTGAYLTQAAIGGNNSVFGPSGTYSPMISRIITSLNTDTAKSQTLLALNPATQAGDNRRVWQLTTGIYVPATSTASLCIGNAGSQLDDGAYIMLDGAQVGVDGKWSSNPYIQNSVTLNTGYNRITYRIANRNTPGSNEDYAQGLYGEIGLSLNGEACTAANLDATARLQIPASINIIEKQVVSISGQVFEDNSGSTAVNSNAYNGIKDAGELGIANSIVTINNCTNTTAIATTKTDANGDYRFSLSPTDLPAGDFCIAQTNLTGYSSVSGTTGYNRTSDTITISNTGAASYSNHNFGDARLTALLSEDGQQTITAGGVVDYPHTLTSQSVLTVNSLNQTSSQQPNTATDTPWQALLYRDTNCNGQVDSGEMLITTQLPLSLKNNEKICLVQRVYAPVTASMGAQHIGQLQASFNVILADATQIAGVSDKRQDTTLLGSAGLSMQKRVRNVASCVSTPANDTGFSLQNEVQNGGYLEYEITYRNNSLKNLVDISVKDSVPSGTIFQNNMCYISPTGICTPSKTGDALLWQIGGTLLPNQQGKVRFCVQTQPLSVP